LHTLLGLTAVSASLYGGILAYQLRKGTIVVDLHPILGLVANFFAICLGIGGFVALITRRFVKMEW